MTDNEVDRVDVLIVGAGPVGLTIANILGQQGIRTHIVEERESLIDYPRGVGLDDESMRTFQSVGLTDKVLPHTVPNQIMRFVNHNRKVIAEIAPVDAPYGWPRRNGFVQPLVDAELLAGLNRFDSVSVSWEQPVVGMENRSSGVEVVTKSSAGTLTTVHAAYVVGCDGGRSITRRHMDTTFDGTTSPTRWLVVDIANDPIGTPNIYVGADPARPYVSVAIAHGIRRFEFMVKDDESTETAITEDYLRERIGHFVSSSENLQIIGRRVYTHHSRIAGTFRKGRMFVAGDAAHLMPVWQGQGYNSGIRDANNLGWKLAAVINGSAEDSLLDTYDSERRKHARSMIDLSTTVGKVISPTNRLVAGVRDAALLAAAKVPSLKRYVVEMRFKPMPRYDNGAVFHGPNGGENSPVGTLFVQPQVETRDGTVSLLDEVLGPWFSILSWANSPDKIMSKDQIDEWLALGAKLVAVRPPSQLYWAGDDNPDVTVVSDVDGKLRSWFDSHEESVVFIRPDKFVAGACIAQDADTVSDNILRAMTLSSTPQAQG